MTRTVESRAAPSRGRLFFWCTAILVVGLGIVAYRALSGRDRPNVLLITIDTWRADALNEKDTPAILELAARGMRFTHARTPVPLTLAAHASLLTGEDPNTHGLRTNTAHALRERSVAEDFREAGYATAAFVASSVLDPRFKLDKGFDRYDNPPRHGAGAAGFQSRDASEQVELFTRWQKARPKGKPYFAWVHLWEPHAPYREYAGDERRPDGTAAGIDSPAELYRGEVRKADWAVEQLLAQVDLEHTIVVITSDHGESLGEHGERTHGHLVHSATMDVPLVLAGPEIPVGRTEDSVCELTDVAGTLRRICEVGLKRRWRRRPDLRALPDSRIVVGESLYGYGLYRWAQQTVAFDGRYVLIDGGPDYALFDRDNDPGETSPLRHAAASAALDEALVSYRATASLSGGTPYSMPGSPYGTVMIKQLSFLRPVENRALPAVRGEWLGATETVLALLNGAIAARNRGLVEKALDGLEPLERADPGNPAFAVGRARAHLHVLDEPREARKALEEAVARGYSRKALEPLFRAVAERKK